MLPKHKALVTCCLLWRQFYIFSSNNTVYSDIHSLAIPIFKGFQKWISEVTLFFTLTNQQQLWSVTWRYQLAHAKISKFGYQVDTIIPPATNWVEVSMKWVIPLTPYEPSQLCEGHHNHTRRIPLPSGITRRKSIHPVFISFRCINMGLPQDN